MTQPPQTPGWGPPTQPPAKPPRQPRQFTITKVAIGVAAGIALFIVGGIVLIAVVVGGGATTASKVSGPTPAATEGPTSPPWDTGATGADQATAADEGTTPTGVPVVNLAVGESGTVTSEDGSGELVVTKIQTTKLQTVADAFGPDLLVPKHGWYVIAHVRATGTSGSFEINPLDFYIKSSNGFHTEDPEYLDAWGPALDSATLHGGEHVSGTIVYDVPTRHGKLVYSPNLDGEPLATWSY